MCLRWSSGCSWRWASRSSLFWFSSFWISQALLSLALQFPQPWLLRHHVPVLKSICKASVWHLRMLVQGAEHIWRMEFWPPYANKNKKCSGPSSSSSNCNISGILIQLKDFPHWKRMGMLIVDSILKWSWIEAQCVWGEELVDLGVCVQLKERRRHRKHTKTGSVHGGPQIPWKHPFLLSWEKGDLLASLCYPIKYHPPLRLTDARASAPDRQVALLAGSHPLTHYAAVKLLLWMHKRSLGWVATQRVSWLGGSALGEVCLPCDLGWHRDCGNKSAYFLEQRERGIKPRYLLLNYLSLLYLKGLFLAIGRILLSQVSEKKKF